MTDGICNNCGATLIGAYCHVCGQREADTEWRSVTAIARQFWDELVNFDFKTAHTLAALISPGLLAREYIAGRRGRFLSPLKVFFLAAALFFLVAPQLTDFSFERQMALDPDGRFRTLVAARLAETGMTREHFADRFDARLQTIYTITPIFSVVAMAAVLRLLYRHRFPWPGPHVVFALYHLAFMFFVWLLLHAINEALGGVDTNLLIVGLFAIVAPYMFLALRRVYADAPGTTAWKTLALLIVTFLIDAPINYAAMLLSVALT